jgi:nitrile hydratase
LKRNFTTAEIDRVLTRGSFSRTATAPARFRPGDRVRARNINPRTHTRLPRYVRGHLGTVERVHGCHVFPDAAAAGKGEQPEWLYTVCFGARELWGDDADPTVTVSIEAFEPYLESV